MRYNLTRLPQAAANLSPSADILKELVILDAEIAADFAELKEGY